MDASQILVIILASALAIFLTLGIILLVILIRVMKQINAITNSARLTAESVQRFVANASKLAAPAVTSKFVLEQIQKFFDKSKSKKKKED